MSKNNPSTSTILIILSIIFVSILNTSRASACPLLKWPEEESKPPDTSPIDSQQGEGTITIVDTSDPDCPPVSDGTPAVVEGNYFTLREGHHYCRIENGDTSCFLWDGSAFAASIPSYERCANFSESWCHVFENVDEHPCTDLSLSRKGELVCLGPESVSVSAQVPCMIVERWPYPRGLVNLENSFSVLGPWKSETGRAFSEVWVPGKLRNYLLEIEWRFNEDSYPVWFFDEREWAEEPSHERGFSVSHTYQTSSWAKPENGPSLNGKLELPAYQVRVYVQWVPWVHRSYEYTVEKRINFSCQPTDGTCLEKQDFCEMEGYAARDQGCYRTVWKKYDSGWVPINLRDFGYTNAYYTSSAAIDISQPPEDIPSVPETARWCDSIPVPVIEVQVYLNAPEY